VGGESWAVYVRRNVSMAHDALVHGPCFVGDDTFIGFKTADMALMPEARVRGFKREVSRFHASQPDPRLLLTTALASAVVRFYNKLYISAAVCKMKPSSSQT
jgi:hypothetical protein